MSVHNQKAHVPDLLLERYLLRELPRVETEDLERQLEGDASLRARLRALEESNQAIRHSYPAAWLAEQVNARLESAGGVRTHRPLRAIYWAVPAGVAAVVILLVAVVPRTAESPDGDGDRIKGLGPSLALYRRIPGGSETLADGDVAHAGDTVRIGYRAAGRAFGAILSIDGRGTVTWHLPPDGGRAVPLKRDPTVLLDTAYELDDAPTFERFYFITGAAAFDAGSIAEAARRAAAKDRRRPPDVLDVPDELEQSTFSLQKEDRP
jgi:hypothetical protein